MFKNLLKISRLSCLFLTLLISSSCSLLTEGETRDGCVEEKIREDGYTREFAQDICEGQYYMYGDDKPQYEVELEELEADLEEWSNDLEEWSNDLESDFDWN